MNICYSLLSPRTCGYWLRVVWDGYRIDFLLEIKRGKLRRATKKLNGG
jgi:hypothetical protein